MNQPLRGRRALVTSGPTYEPIDPVRFIGNRSSGRQGHAIADALVHAGAEVVLVHGPVSIAPPAGAEVHAVTTARQMHRVCMEALPVDVALCVAAVSDWRPRTPKAQKQKKETTAQPVIELVENPDILRDIAQHPTQRPALVVGFAAETEDVLAHAHSKYARKGCDWLLANAVGDGKGFDQERNAVTLLYAHAGALHAEPWPEAGKAHIASELVQRIAQHFAA